MEILESLKSLVEDTVMSKMENQGNPCGERVDGGSGLMGGGDDVGYGGVQNVEVGDQGVVGGGVLSGGVEGVGDGENCWGFGEMERGVLGNECVAGGNEGKECGLGPEFVGAVQYGFENESGFELVRDVCLSDMGIEEVGNDMLIMQEAAIEEVGVEKVVMHEGIQEVGVEKVVMHEGIQEAGDGNIVMHEGIQEVGDGNIVMHEGIKEVGAEKVVIQEGMEEVGVEKVVIQEGVVKVGDEDVVMQEAVEVEKFGAEKVVTLEGFEVVGAEKSAMHEGVGGDEKGIMKEGDEEVKAEKVLMQEADKEAGDADVVMQDGVKEQYVSQQNLAHFGNKIDVSNSGISIYVDVFGQVDSEVQGHYSSMVEQGSLQRSLNEGNLSKGSSAPCPDNEIKGSTAEVQDCSVYKNAEEKNDVEGGAVSCIGHMFSVGDLVWAKTNTQLWWPGVIFGHSDLSNDTAEGEEDLFQVRLFGSGNVLWGRTSQLKPFQEYFEQMSRQSSSKSFYCAVEKAVDEIGRRVKLEMTCPCYPEESKIADVADGGGKIFKEKAYKLDELPVLQFEPEKLLARIKCFACDVTLPAAIESKVIQSRLSAFYRSIGHPQLPIHQLKPTDAENDDQNVVSSEVFSSKQALKSRTRSSHRELEDGKNEALCALVSSEMKLPSPISPTSLPGKKVNSVERLDCGTNGKLEKSYESRERRKSKYLSFPYVDSSQLSKSLNNDEGNEMADPSDDTSRSTRTVKSRDKTKKNPCRKSTGQDLIIPDVINASSAELLSKLRFTALDCLYPNESKQFDIMQCFVSRFRKFAFHDFTFEDAVSMGFENEIDLFKTSSEMETDTEIGMLKKDTKSRKRENTTLLGLNTKPTDGFPGNITTSGSIVIDFQTDTHASESQTVPMKRTKKAKKTPGFPEIKVIARLSDLKGSNVGAQLEGFSACTPNKGKSNPKRKKEATSANHPVTDGVDLPGEHGPNGIVGAGLKEIEVMGPYSLHNIPGLNKEGTKEPVSLHGNAELAPEQPDVSKNTGPVSVMKGIPQTGMLSPDKPELKRKRKQKGASVTSTIPDLNGNTIETQLSEMKCISSEVKPQRKGRKKKADAGLVDINLSSSEAQVNEEALGTALLLKFAAEAPMPTPEDLVSAFSIFGPLKDSEAKVFNDSGTAQVVFINSSDARTAFCSLEKNSPFGPALVNYRLQVVFAAAGISGPHGSGFNMHQIWPAEKVKSPPKPRTAKKPKNLGKPYTVSDPQGKSTEAPDLQFVRQNLQMMTSMLENAGDNISPEMRVKLETEIKSLLNRVTSMVGSSSS